MRLRAPRKKKGKELTYLNTYKYQNNPTSRALSRPGKQPVSGTEGLAGITIIDSCSK